MKWFFVLNIQKNSNTKKVESRQMVVLAKNVQNIYEI